MTGNAMDLSMLLNKKLAEADCRLFVYNCNPRLNEGISESDPQTSVYEMFDASFADAVIIDPSHIGNGRCMQKDNQPRA